MSTQPHRWNEYGVAQDPNLIEITIDNLTYVQISTAMAPMDRGGTGTKPAGRGAA